MIRILAAASTAPDAAVNLVSRSGIKNLKLSAWSSRFISRLQACCVAHSAVDPAGHANDRPW
jgi:hypothetical protein